VESSFPIEFQFIVNSVLENDNDNEYLKTFLQTDSAVRNLLFTKYFAILNDDMNILDRITDKFGIETAKTILDISAKWQCDHAIPILFYSFRIHENILKILKFLKYNLFHDTKFLKKILFQKSHNDCQLGVNDKTFVQEIIFKILPNDIELFF
jgi:hypothetical protein